MKINTFAIITMVFVFLVVSCGPSKDNASIEPNDEIYQANTISLGTEFSMAIYPEGDVDWYEVEVPGQGYLQVLVRDVPDGIGTPRARLATFDEWGEQQENYLTDFLRTPCAMHVLEEGNYFVRINARSPRQYSEDEFYVKFNFVEEFDPHEPNNSVEEAVELEFGEEYKSAIYPRYDEDWFKFRVEEQGYLQTKARNVPDNLELRAYYAIYDEYGEEKVDVIRGIERLPTAVAVTEPGDYYVVLNDRRGRNESKDLFNWKVNFIPEMDKYEPNDHFTDAKEIGLNDTIQIAIFPKGDKDFFKINPENTGKLRIMSRNHGDIDPTVAFYSLDPDDPNKLKELKSKSRLPAEFEIEEIDQYYLKISDRRHRNESQDLFDVILRYE